MDAAGSAVGLASLGIQLCQGLVSYYQDWQSYHDDIAAACDKVCALQRTFELLKDSLSEPSLDPKRAANVHESLLSCTNSIHGLEKRCTKLRASGQPTSLRERTVAVTKRTLYPFKASTLAKVSEAVNDMLDQLSTAVQSLHLGLSVSTHGQLLDIAGQVDDVTVQLGGLKHDLSEWRRDDQCHKMMNWISAPDQRTYHDAARQKHEPGTGQWLLDSDSYKTWKSASRGHIWLHGKAGCGKSVLCSTLIQDLKLQCKADKSTALAYFYFSFSDLDNQGYRSFLASLVHQLTDEASYDKLKQSLDSTKQASVTVLEEVFLFQITQHASVTIVLDALDEVSEDDERPMLLARLQALADGAMNMKTLILSRISADIESAMLSIGAHILPLPSSEVNVDIRNYITSEFSQSPSLLRWSPKMQQKAKETLELRADGMFRWVYCQLRELKTLRSTRERSIEAALHSLPVGLDATYKKMVDRIDPRDRKEAVAMLRWLSFAMQPLTLGELQDTRLIDSGDDGVVAWDDPGSIEDIAKILGDLIQIDVPFDASSRQVQRVGCMERDWFAYESYHTYVRQHSKGIGVRTVSHDFTNDDQELYNAWLEQGGKPFAKVRLAHFSVKEYLTSVHAPQATFQELRLEENLAHRSMAEDCLVYLRSFSERIPDGWSELEKLKFPLLNYAVNNWPAHVDKNGGDALPHEISLLQNDKTHSDWLLAKYGTFYNGLPNALICASELGHQACVEELLESGHGVDIVGGWNRSETALQIASLNGYLGIVQLLLKAGADVNFVIVGIQGFRTTALCEAATNGHEKIVAALLLAGADVQPVTQLAHSICSTAALHIAAAQGHAFIVKQLIDAGSDVNAVGFEPVEFSANAPSLHFAAASGHEVTVRILIEAGAEVNARSDGVSALGVAAAKGHVRVVGDLVQYGAYISFADYYGHTALMIAAAEGHTDVVQTLIDEAAGQLGAIPGFEQAIDLATKEGHKHIEQMLLDRFTDS